MPPTIDFEPIAFEPEQPEAIDFQVDFEPDPPAAMPDPGAAARREAMNRTLAGVQEVPLATRLAAGAYSGIQKGLYTPDKLVLGAIDLALGSVGAGDTSFGQRVAGKLKAINDRDMALAEQDRQMFGNDPASKLTEGIGRAATELPLYLVPGGGAATPAAAVVRSAIAGGVVGGGTQYAQDRGEGKGRAVSALYGLNSGAITALTTRAFGATGAESIFRTEGVQGIRNRLLAVFKAAGMEGAEETVDQVQQDLLERITREPNKPLGQSLTEALMAGLVGVGLGGGVGATVGAADAVGDVRAERAANREFDARSQTVAQNKATLAGAVREPIQFVPDDFGQKQPSTSRNPPSASSAGFNPSGAAGATPATPDNQSAQVRAELEALPGAESDLKPNAGSAPSLVSGALDSARAASTPAATLDNTPATKADLKALADFIQNGGNNPFAPKPASAPADVTEKPAQTTTGYNVQPGTEMPVQATPGAAKDLPPAAAGQTATPPPVTQTALPAGGTLPAATPAQGGENANGQKEKGRETLLAGDAQPINPPPAAKLTTPPAAIVVKKGGRKGFRIQPRSDGIADVLDAIQEEGGLRSPTAADVSDGDYDGFKEAMIGPAALLRRRTEGHHPTDIVKAIQAEFPRIKTSGDLYQAIRDAVAQRDNLRRNGGGAEAQQQRFWDAATAPKSTSGLVKINANQLAIGHTFRLRAPGVSHEELTVTHIDADTGEVQVKDGTSFGVQDLPDGAEIWVQKKGLAPELNPAQVKPSDARNPVNPPNQPASPQPGGKPAVGGAVPASASDPGALRARERLERAIRAVAGNENVEVKLSGPPTGNGLGNGAGRSLASGLQSIADVFGKRIVWFTASDLESGRNLRGFADPSGKYILVNSDYPLTALGTTVHELLHQFQNSNPLLYADFKRDMMAMAKLTGSTYQDVKWSANAYGHDLSDELMCDFAAHAFNDPKFLRDFAARDPGLFRRVVNRLVKLLDRILFQLTRAQKTASEVFPDLQAARDRLAKALVEWADYEQNVKKVRAEIDKVNGENNQFSMDRGDDLFSAPESVADQKARLDREKRATDERKAKEAMQARAAARLTGKDIDTTLDAFANDATTRLDKSGQGSFFSTDKDGPDRAANLAAVHNTTAAKLQHMLKMGGLPVPSIAIIRADKAALEGFGDISLVGTPDLVTPSTDTKVLNADAYSPRYPTVQYFPDPKSVTAVQNMVTRSLAKLPLDQQRNFSKFNLFNESPEKSAAAALKQSPEMMLAYLDATGAMPAFPKSEDPRYQQQTDYSHLRNLVTYDETVKPKFEAWVDDQIKALGVTEQEKIFKGFTNGGNRSYAPHTLENVVQIMKKGFRDAEGFNYGVGSVRATSARQFRTLKVIQDQRGAIIPKAQMDALKEEVDSEFSALADTALPYRDGGKNTGFGALDAFSDDLKAMAQGGAENFRHLRQMYPGGEPFEKMRSFLDKLRTLPTEYFEAKVKRAVQLQEFAGAVVPEGTSPDLIAALKKRGLEVQTYPKGNAEARRAAVQKIGETRQALFETDMDPPDIVTLDKLKSDITAAEQALKSAVRAAVDPNRAIPRADADQAAALATANLRALQDEYDKHPDRLRAMPLPELEAHAQATAARLAEIAETPVAIGSQLPDDLRGERWRLMREAKRIAAERWNRPEIVAAALRKAEKLTDDLRAATKAQDATAMRHAIEELQALQDAEFTQIKPDLLAAVRADLEAKGEIKPLAVDKRGRTLADLTDWMKARKLDSPNLTLSERVNLAKRLADEFNAGKDKLTHALVRSRAMWQAFKAQWKAPLKDDSVRAIFKEWHYEKQFSGIETHQFASKLRTNIPKKVRRMAISVWLDANGDRGLLTAQKMDVPARFLPVWTAALNLTADEKALAMRLKQDFAQKLADGQLLGLIEKGRDSYGVPQIWEVLPQHGEDYAGGDGKSKRPRNPGAKLDPRDPFFALKRTHDTYFDGIMAGGIPRSLDIADLVGVYNVEFHGALADRSVIKALKDARMPDNTAAVKVSGGAKIEVLPTGARVQFVDSNWKPADAVAADGRPYRAVDHWALRGWKFAATDAAGNPIMVQGDFLVHPDLYAKIKTQLEGKSALRDPEGPLGAIAHITGGLLKSGAFLKASKFASATFHGATLAEHMMTHAFSGMPSRERLALLNPYVGGVEINPAKDREVANLIRHGMDMGYGGYRAMFEEGLTSHGGIWAHVPGLGDAMAWLSDGMFKEYLPRLKVKLGKAVLHANRARYSSKLTEQQIYELTANQVNAAFGGQNWALLGRSKTFLDVNRLFLTAPDFLLSRAKVVGQAMKPYNREQMLFILAQAALVYGAARIFNLLLDDDPHWEPENALQVIHGGKSWSARFIVNDMLHAFTDPAGFASGRLGPWPRTGFEMITGRDMRTGARKDVPIDTENPAFRAAQIAAVDLAQWLIPVGADGLLPGATGREQTGPGQFALGLVGVGSRRYTAETEMFQLAAKFNRKSEDPRANRQQKMRDDAPKQQSAYRKLDVLLEADDLEAARKEYRALIGDGHSKEAIAQRMKATTDGHIAHPFTGSQAQESFFKASLTPDQLLEYNRAIEARKARAAKFGQMLHGQN